MEKTIRYRCNVSTSTKGIKTPDCTVEITTDEDYDIESDITKRVDSLAKKMTELYPVEKEK